MSFNDQMRLPDRRGCARYRSRVYPAGFSTQLFPRMQRRLHLSGTVRIRYEVTSMCNWSVPKPRFALLTPGMVWCAVQAGRLTYRKSLLAVATITEARFSLFQRW